MKTNENQTTYAIYYRQLKQWIDGHTETQRDGERVGGNTRKEKTRAGAC